jgi:hypothetical protein
MRGNVYMCLNTATYNEKIPTELVASYGIPSYDEEGTYYIIELEVSWKSGEITALLKLGEGLSYPNNTLMTNTEAHQFINENTSDPT